MQGRSHYIERNPWEGVYQRAGIVGVDPLEFSLRELVQMCEGRIDETWWYFSHIKMMIYNAMAKKPKDPHDFHPLWVPAWKLNPGMRSEAAYEIRDAWSRKVDGS